MSRKRTLFFLALSLLCPSLLAQSLDELILPKKTEVFISLQRALNSKTARTGDKFSAVVEVPVTFNDKIILPVGSYVIGHVIRAEGAGYIKGKAQLQLGFDTVILPDGVTRQMRAALQEAEGYPTDPSNEEGEIESPGNQSEEVAVAAATGAVTGVITGATVGVFRNGVGRGAAVGAAVGAVGGALLGLLKKGEEVELPRGASLTIQLQEAVRFVKPQAPTQGTDLTQKP